MPLLCVCPRGWRRNLFIIIVKDLDMTRWINNPKLWARCTAASCTIVLGYKVYFLVLAGGACSSDSHAFQKQAVYFFKTLGHVFFMGGMVAFEKNPDTFDKQSFALAFWLYDVCYLVLTGTNYCIHCDGPESTDFMGTIARFIPYTLTTLVLYWSTVYEPNEARRPKRDCLHMSNVFILAVVTAIELFQLRYTSHGHHIEDKYIYDYFNVKTAMVLFQIWAGVSVGPCFVALIEDWLPSLKQSEVHNDYVALPDDDTEAGRQRQAEVSSQSPAQALVSCLDAALQLARDHSAQLDPVNTTALVQELSDLQEVAQGASVSFASTLAAAHAQEVVSKGEGGVRAQAQAQLRGQAQELSEAHRRAHVQAQGLVATQAQELTAARGHAELLLDALTRARAAAQNQVDVQAEQARAQAHPHGDSAVLVGKAYVCVFLLSLRLGEQCLYHIPDFTTSFEGKFVVVGLRMVESCVLMYMLMSSWRAST